MTQYVAIELKVGSKDFQTWTQRYRPTGNGIPMLFIVASDGREVYNRSGAPQGPGLNRLLKQGIEDTGGVKTVHTAKSRELEKRRATIVKRAKRMLGLGDAAAATKLVATLWKDKEALEKNAESPSVKELTQLVSTLVDDAEKQVTQADEKLKSASDSIIGVVALVRVERVYGELPEVKESVDERLNPLRLSEEQSELVKQAEMVDRARALEEKKSLRTAISAYKKVVDAYPDSRAAELCKLRIEQLSPKK